VAVAVPTTPPAPPAEPAPDRVPVELAGGTPEPLRSELESVLGPGRVLPRALDLVRYASDASPYRLIPRAVVMAHDAGDVAAVLAYGRRSGVPVTLRSGGTSLNGQAQGNGVVVDVRRHFRGFVVEDQGARVRVKPGTVLGHPNRALVRYGRRLGPDPASTDFATVGGVIANNSGGMRCGVVHDSYSTLRSLEFVLPSGTVVNSDAPDAAERFAAVESELAQGLAQIRDEIRADAGLSERIRRKFEIKNTTGYRLCAFLDADEPVEIFRRLLVGSEGTLAFVSEAVFDTVPHGRMTTNALLFFPDIDAAAVPVPALVAAGASAVELMVNPTLIAASYSLPGVPERWREIPPDGAVLLVEMRTDDAGELDALERRALEAVSGCELLEEARFTRDPEESEVYWRVREGMQGIVGALRPQGTALIIEDVCVPPARIAECARDVQALLAEHEFLTGVAGHASAGNLHFLLTPKLSEPSDRDRYERFMTGLVALIVDKYDGSLKAEHGTGRNMAPYVEREWGPKATELMWRIKQLADPDGVLAPDVLLSRDDAVHLRDLKSTPPIEDVSRANACIECGFCEPVCPSRHITTTPRQRIVLRREMARQPEGSPLRAALAREYAYDGEETCAADGSCRMACPVAIDTGKLIKELRARSHSARAERRAAQIAGRWAATERLGRLGLRAGVAVEGVAGERAVNVVTGALRRLAGDELVPRWSSALPRAAPAKLPATERADAAAVYLPACINRMLGTSRRDGASRWLPEALVEVSRRAGRPVWIPPDAAGHCCATPWASKGFREGHALMARRIADSLWRWSDGGALPVVIDASSCAHGIATDVPEALDDERREQLAGVRVTDSVTWAGEDLLPRLEVRSRASSATVHPTCSARQLNLTRPLEALAQALSDDVFVAIEATCCGMAGDRGLLHPELTAAATADEARELTGRGFDAYLSSNRTCEIALEQATGRPYESVVQLLERATRPVSEWR
jgi:D-lactate dehydrogenase